MTRSWKEEYRRSLKSMDTEEHIDLAFYRPIGFMWACLAERFGVSPNAITIASIFLGIGAGVLFYFPELWINVVGMFLLIWANSFDSADGQLARMTCQYSRIGRILDGLSGDFWFLLVIRRLKHSDICCRCPFRAVIKIQGGYSCVCDCGYTTLDIRRGFCR